MSRFFWIVPGFIAGLLPGLLWPRVEPVPGPAAVPAALAAPKNGEPAEEVAALPLPVRFTDELVWLPKDQFQSLLVTAHTCRLKLPDILNLENTRRIPAICAYLGMTSGESEDFQKILVDAAQARLAWEKQHVTATRTGPAEWRIRFPGDGGKCLSSLRAQLRQRFGEDRLAWIDLLGDLDGCFAPDGHDQLGFRHGDVTLRARYGNEMVDRQRVVDVAIISADRTLAIQLRPGVTYLPDSLLVRLSACIGGLDAIHRAVEAAEPER